MVAYIDAHKNVYGVDLNLQDIAGRLIDVLRHQGETADT